MKIVLFIFHISYFIFLAATPVAAVRLPVIIDSATLSHPLDSADQNYLPSDPAAVNTVKHVKTITLSETHSPTVVGTDSNGDPIYQPKKVKSISGSLNFSEHTNYGYRYLSNYLATPYTNPLADTTTLNQEFLTYNNSNAVRRSLPAYLQKCLIGQRLVSAYRTLVGDFSGTTVDIIVCQSSKCGHNVRLSEIAFFFRNQPYFYNPSQPCPASATDGQPLSSFVTVSKVVNTPLNLEKYQKLYQYAVEPVDDNSLGTLIEQCDLNSAGHAVNCQTQISSSPHAGVAASLGNRTASALYTPASATTVSRDFGSAVTGASIDDRPNPLNILAQFYKEFIVDKVKKLTGPTQVTYNIDTRLEEGLRLNETANRHLLPASALTQLKSASSTTNGSTLDPGKANADTLLLFKKWLYPASWQAN